MNPAALAYPITASGIVIAGRGLFRGFAYAETGGAAASVAFYDASTAATLRPLIPPQPIASGGAGVISLGAMVVAFEQGLRAVITGALTVVVFANAQTRLGEPLAVFDSATEDVTPLGLARTLAELGG